MNTITLLIGNIAAGKSTFTDKIVKETDYVISKDDYREYYGGISGQPYLWDEKIESLIHKMVMARTEAIMYLGDYDLIMDETFMTMKTRSPYIALADKYGYSVRGILFEDLGEDEHVRRRMEHDGRGFSEDYWRGVYQWKKTRWEYPRASEGFDQIIPSW